MVVGVLVLEECCGGGLDLRYEGALLSRHGLLGGRRTARGRLPVRAQPRRRDVRLIAPAGESTDLVKMIFNLLT